MKIIVLVKNELPGYLIFPSWRGFDFTYCIYKNNMYIKIYIKKKLIQFSFANSTEKNKVSRLRNQ